MTVRVINQPSQDDLHGGPAFPLVFQWAATADCQSPISGAPLKPGDIEHVIKEGMTIRDYFAAKAIAGHNPGSRLPDIEVEEYAKWAYRMADAMLAARRSA